MEKKSIFLAPTFGRASNDLFYAGQVLFFSVLGKDSEAYRKRLAELLDDCFVLLQRIESDAEKVAPKSNVESKEN